MQNDLKHSIQIAALYVGSIVGAGFASGQEVGRFFIAVRGNGFYGIVVATVLFILASCAILLRVYDLKLCGNRYYTALFGHRLGAVADGLLLLFLMLTFCIMAVGSGALFTQQFALDGRFGIIALLVPVFFVLACEMKGFMNITTVITPLMVLGIFTCSIFGILTQIQPTFAGITQLAYATNHWLPMAIFYVSYNMLITAPILSNLSSYITSKKVAVMSGVIGGCVIGVLLLCIRGALHFVWVDASALPLPMLSVVGRLGQHFSLLYAVTLYLAMFCAATACGFTVVEQLRTLFKIHRVWCAGLLCLLVMPFSQLGFQNLVGKGYVIFGIAGVWILASYLIDGLNLIRTKT
ncbi:MAG: hypothetical protein H7Y41_07335 [Hyphomonadaceae bacterium]|nr:hypothetical protein [Clostridia bacterium]